MIRPLESVNSTLASNPHHRHTGLVFLENQTAPISEDGAKSEGEVKRNAA